MRSLQLIDSLNAGGAERMAINLANGLSKLGNYSALVATRTDGSLLQSINPNVDYLCLKRRKVLDIKALFKLKKIVKDNNITHIHAHASSYFFGTLLKLIYPKVKLIWHDHLGGRVNQKGGDKILSLCALLFYRILVVNIDLLEWHKIHTPCKRIDFLPNFAVENNVAGYTELKGMKGKRMVCLANLKNPKNHLFLVQSFFESKVFEHGWSLHLIGEDFNDDYSKNIKIFITQKGLKESVFLYDSRKDITHILRQAEIGILSSTSEGFPVSLLEYAMSGLAIVTTNVGYCSKIIEHEKNGLLFDPTNSSSLVQSFRVINEDDLLVKYIRSNAQKQLKEEYSENKICQRLIDLYHGE